MKLSIVVPAYNEENYLLDCLQSIRLDTLGLYDVEVIVVNNASTDRTAEIARLFPEVKLVDELCKGLPYARQAGMDHSTGELIANIDADSRVPVGWVRNAIEEFEKDAWLVCLSGPFKYYDLSPVAQFGVRMFYLLGKGMCTLSQWFNLGSMVQGGNFVVRRSALEQIGGYDTHIKFYGEDTDIARRLFQMGNVKFDLAFIMGSSARRLKKEGIAVMATRYTLNYIWVMLFKKPFTFTYKELT